MALNKRKVLDAARKHAQKGAKAKALKEYEKLLKADPRDAKLLLEVGDAYRRWGQAEEAIGQYAKVAAQYRQDGFDARAVAVFKQILNLDPKHYAAFVSLGELYQRMGLDSEAVAALQMAADGYHKEGRKPEALELLRQMAALDPTNTTSRLKVAELLRQEGMEDDAVVEYQAVAAELENQQERNQLIVVLERILEINPDHLETLSILVRHLMVASDLAKAEPIAVHALNISTEPPQYELLIDLYAQMGDDAKLADATRGLAKLYRDRGDEDKARDLMQRLPAEGAVAPEARMAVDVSEEAMPELDDEELLDEPFLSIEENPELDLGASSTSPIPQDIDLNEVSRASAPPPTSAEAASGALSEGDPDQLLAEASVYLRYGKCDQAIASLRSVLVQDPNHRGALEKLGEAFLESGQNSDAVSTWLRAAEQARLAGDGSSLESLREQVVALDPALAAQIGTIETTSLDLNDDSAPSIGAPPDINAQAPPAPDLDLDIEIDLDLDLDLDQAIDEVSESDTETGMQSAGAAGAPLDAELEIELDDDSIVFDTPPDTSTDSVATPSPAVDLAADDDFEVELDLSQDDISGIEAPADETDASLDAADVDDDFEFEIDPGELTDEGSNAESADSNAHTADTEATPSVLSEEKVTEELEEAEFYVAQDMFDEAEEILKRVLAALPAHGAALVMMGEIAAARGGAAAVDETPMPPMSEVTQPDFEIDAAAESDEEDVSVAAVAETPIADIDAADLTDEFEIEIDMDDEGELSAEAVAAPEVEEVVIEAAAATDEVELDLNADVEEELDLAADEPVAPAAQAPAIEAEVEVEAASEVDAAEEEPEPSKPDVAAEAPSVDEEVAEEIAAAPEMDAALALEAEPAQNAGDAFDLREALADVIDDDEVKTPDANETAAVLSTVGDGFESIFSDFKKGVTATLDDGDFDTRYDLGIAYREMGLFDDAIGEFRVCLDSPNRRFDSLYLMGLCARDLTRWDDAVNHLEQALALPEIPTERLAGVYFDLSIAHEGSGDSARALAAVQRVLEIEDDFPGAQDRLAALESGESALPEVGAPGEVYESFDDLFGDEEDDEDGDEEVIETAPVEAFESFDDVVSEAETVLEEAQLVEAEPVAATEDAVPEETTDPGDSKRTSRKKISFV